MCEVGEEGKMGVASQPQHMLDLPDVEENYICDHSSLTQGYFPHLKSLNLSGYR